MALPTPHVPGVTPVVSWQAVAADRVLSPLPQRVHCQPSRAWDSVVLPRGGRVGVTAVVAACVAAHQIQRPRKRQLRSHQDRQRYGDGRHSVALQAQPSWSDVGCGSGLEMVGAGIIRRRDYAEKVEGNCVAIPEQPMRVQDAARGRTHYAEIKIENDCQTWGGGLEIGVTALTPAEVGKSNPEDLRWSELPRTWVLREDGALRFEGRPYPRDAQPGTGLKVEKFDTRRLEIGDRLGLRADQSALVIFINGEAVGRLDLQGTDIELPADGDLYLIADVVGKACELELLDTEVPE